MEFNRVWVSGDKHGDFNWLPRWCEEHQTTPNDALILCGDTGFLYYGADNWREKHMKRMVAGCPITILCVRGNHEARPENYSTMNFINLDDDPSVISGYYFESDYPNIRYIADGSILDINEKSCLFIGGAYSVDKEFRQLMGYRWFADEELTTEEMVNILDKIDHKYFVYVFTHTCPEAWQPSDLFMSSIDQSKISHRMEQFLTTVSEIIDFDTWYFGHFHADRNILYSPTHPGQGEAHMLYNAFEKICE